jgi:predicted nuclease with TOPRIM domain
MKDLNYSRHYDIKGSQPAPDKIKEDFQTIERGINNNESHISELRKFVEKEMDIIEEMMKELENEVIIDEDELDELTGKYGDFEKHITSLIKNINQFVNTKIGMFNKMLLLKISDIEVNKGKLIVYKDDLSILDRKVKLLEDALPINIGFWRRLKWLFSGKK